MQTNEFMSRAIELSKRNMETNAGGPFGAVVVKDGKIIGEGWNQVTSTNDPTAHAEVQAIRNACKNLNTFDLNGAEIFTSCEPCPMCLSAIYWARLGKIYYANTKKDAAAINFDDDFIYQEIPKPYPQRSIPLVPLMREEALQIFKIWGHKVDKIPY
jgi:tRNA(Arg) A34 adenosine deaminase TadA